MSVALDNSFSSPCSITYYIPFPGSSGSSEFLHFAFLHFCIFESFQHIRYTWFLRSCVLASVLLDSSSFRNFSTLELRLFLTIELFPPGDGTQTRDDELFFLFQSHLVVRVNKLLRHLAILAEDDEEEEFHDVDVAEHGGPLGEILLAVLLVELGVAGPMRRGVLVVHHMIVLVQHVHWAVQQRHRHGVFVVRVVGVDEGMPAPVNRREDEDILQQRIDDIGQGKDG